MSKKQEELKELAKPLVDLLYRDYHPHAKIIIDQAGVEIVEGVITVRNELKDQKGCVESESRSEI